MMIDRIIECVPNFSEGRKEWVIGEIANSIKSIEGVKLLDVDPGWGANRTVYTFAGLPEAVAEAAFLSVKTASQLIDMSLHTGAHPRIGACDVMPFVPVKGVTMEEAVKLARAVSKRIGEELNIPVYCYEEAAFNEKRRNLANCRSGEYEGLAKKMADPKWRPDFGPTLFNPKSGASVVGARDFLVAYNINLGTNNVGIANEIAKAIRESGEVINKGDKKQTRILGKFKNVKAIGWYIDEYGKAQVSMNFTNINITPLHPVFEEVKRLAKAKGITVTGSELIGLIPKKVLVEAGNYFADKPGIPEAKAIEIAVDTLGLAELAPFDPQKKILEYCLEG